MRTEARLLLKLTVASLCFLSAQTQAQNIVERVQSSDASQTGSARIEFPPETYLKAFVDQRYDLRIASYEGEVVGGLAEGRGALKLTQSGYLGAIWQPSIYVGEFKQGIPVGDGELFTRDFDSAQLVSGIFSGAQITSSLDGMPLAVWTPVDSQNKVLLRAMRYVGTRPTRMFFGEVGPDGRPVGEWVDLPWYLEKGDQGVAGLGRHVEFWNGPAQMVCTMDPRPAEGPETVGALMQKSGGLGINFQRLSWADRYYIFGRGECETTNSDGWRYRYAVDFSKPNELPGIIACWEPSGREGRVLATRACEQRRRRRHDVFTNIGQEFKRFIDRRIIGSINRAAEPVERAMCRATGTEAGVNCNVNAQVGVAWPVGDGATDHLPPEERQLRNEYVAASRLATTVPGRLADTDVGEAAAMAADLGAVCTALCSTASQREFSQALLSELQKVATEDPSELNVRRVAGISRETASVLSGGLRTAIVAAPVLGLGVKYYSYRQSVAQAARIGDAILLVQTQPGPTEPLEQALVRQRILNSLYTLQLVPLNDAAVHGVHLLGAAIQSNIRILRNASPNKVRAISAALALGRTRGEIDAFIEKYKDVQSEQELYDAIIRETIAPLGLTWPLQT